MSQPAKIRPVEQQVPDIHALETKIKELESQLKDKGDQYLYLYADLENFKKRTLQERIELAKFATEPMGRELLDVVDNIERAIAHLPEGSGKRLIEGLGITLKQFKAVLERHGIREMQPLGPQFDPEHQEAVAEEHSDKPAGEVIRIEAPAYKFHDRLLRPARVVLSAGRRS